MQESSRNDSELVERALDGNLDAFDAIVRRYQDAVYAIALHRTGNFADAQDIAQEAFLTAYTNLSKLRDPSKLASWLHTITLYTYNHWQRKHPAMEMLDAHDGSSEVLVRYKPSRPDELIERQELRSHCIVAEAYGRGRRPLLHRWALLPGHRGVSIDPMHDSEGTLADGTQALERGVA